MKSLTEGTISRKDNWVTAWVGEELMMMSADSSAYLSLSGSGGRIWEMLSERQTLDGLCGALAAEYEVGPESVRNEVLAFLERLQQQHAIELHPSAVA